MKTVGIRGIGMYVPEQKLTNDDLEKMVETSDEWIVSRTGISERRIAGKDLKTSDMALRAARMAMERAELAVDECAFVISSTASHEVTCPAQAARVAGGLGLTNSYCFDINAACSGLVFALALGQSLLQTRGGGAGLITASEKMSSFVDYTDRTSCVLLGDGAAALTLATEPPFHPILTTELGTDPTGAEAVKMGGTEAHGTLEDLYFKQDGRAVFRFAVTKLKELIRLMLERTGVKPSDRFFVVPHQANLRMIENVAKDMGLSMDRFVMNIQKYGNTSSASIGLALAEAEQEGRFKPGDKVFLVGFGGGLSWGAMAIEW